MFCTDMVTVLSGEQQRLCHCLKINRWLWTREKIQQLLKKTSTAAVSRAVLSLQEKQSSTSSGDEGCEEKLFSALGFPARQERSPWGPSHCLSWSSQPLGATCFSRQKHLWARTVCELLLLCAGGKITTKSLWLYPLLRNKWKISACKEF